MQITLSGNAETKATVAFLKPVVIPKNASNVSERRSRGVESVKAKNTLRTRLGWQGPRLGSLGTPLPSEYRYVNVVVRQLNI